MVPAYSILLLLLPVVNCKSLVDVVCGLNNEKCGNFKESFRTHEMDTRRNNEPPLPGRHSRPSLGAPSAAEFARWQNYETNEPGTGLVQDAGPGYGPGLGDVEIRTGVGVQYPYGGLGIRRDFGLFMGGSGRSGGQAFGWGNGSQRRSGAAPWAWPY